MNEQPPSIIPPPEKPQEPTFKPGALVQRKKDRNPRVLVVLGTHWERSGEIEEQEVVWVWTGELEEAKDALDTFSVDERRQAFEDGEGLPEDIKFYRVEILKPVPRVLH
ncbi:hypothetical protein HY968_03815 [Candidatus Kaiserbacteria bacterium]|nr:hypothetical protein [Candidatus Kaiserbacteria bacterium]